jgi:hypothetical protein
MVKGDKDSTNNKNKIKKNKKKVLEMKGKG